MGHRNTISGHIQEPWYIRGEDQNIARLWHHNHRVIHGLSQVDVFPPITRGMFGTSPIHCKGHTNPETGEYLWSSSYRGPVIYFGGSFSSIYAEWEAWLEKFESLLRQLYWEHAVVMLCTEYMGNHAYRWEAEFDKLDADDPNIRPIAQWKFTGEPRNFHA